MIIFYMIITVKIKEAKYEFDGKANTETEKNIGCKDCKYYQKQCLYDNIYIFDILEERKRKQEEQKNERAEK